MEEQAKELQSVIARDDAQAVDSVVAERHETDRQLDVIHIFAFMSLRDGRAF